MRDTRDQFNTILQEKVLSLIGEQRQKVRENFITEMASAKTAELVKQFQALPEGYEIYPSIWTATSGTSRLGPTRRNSNLAPAIKIAKDFGFIEQDGVDGTGKPKYKRTSVGLVDKPASPAE